MSSDLQPKSKKLKESEYDNLVFAIVDEIEKRKRISDAKAATITNENESKQSKLNMFFSSFFFSKIGSDAKTEEQICSILSSVMLPMYKEEKDNIHINEKDVEVTKYSFFIPYPFVISYSMIEKIARLQNVIRVQLEEGTKSNVPGSEHSIVVSVLVNNGNLVFTDSQYEDLQELQSKRDSIRKMEVMTGINPALAIVRENIEVSLDPSMPAFRKKSNDGRDLTLIVQPTVAQGPIKFAQMTAIKAAQIIYDIKFRCKQNENKIVLMYETL